MIKNNSKMLKKLYENIKQTSILHSKLTPRTGDVICSKLYRARENILIRQICQWDTQVNLKLAFTD